jgi:3-phenylpropionate/trans-cinnamate dioxygenase ferredoxin component
MLIMAIYEDTDMLISDNPAPATPVCPSGNAVQWTDVLGEQQLAEGGRWFARRGGHEIALFRIQGTVHAIADSCPHNGASLATGLLEGTTIKCRAHGMRFDITTGCPRAAGGFALRTYRTRVHDGRVEVDLGTSAD